MPNQPHDKASSLQLWIVKSRDGDEIALNQLAEYLLPKAFEFANRKMLNLSPIDDFEDVAISAVKSICLRFRNGQRDFLGEMELVSLLRQFVTGKIRDRRKYHLADKRNVNMNVGDDDLVQNSPSQDHATDDANSIWLDEQSMNLPIVEQAYLAEMLDCLGGVDNQCCVDRC